MRNSFHPVLSRLREWTNQILIRHTRRRLQRQVSTVLSDQSPPDFTRSLMRFDEMQVKAQPKTLYGYDDRSLWERAMGRMLQLLRLPGVAAQSKTFVELGSGDSLLAHLLTLYGHKVIALDLADWRHPLASNVHLVAADISKGLPLEDACADYVISYNTFEHLPDPNQTFTEALRILRPEGIIHLDFAPLYTGPWGLHAYSVFKMPYPQFLFPEDFILHQIATYGVQDLGQRRTTLQFVNRWTLDQYKKLWNSREVNIIKFRHTPDDGHVRWIHDFPECFTGRHLTYRDVTAGHILATLQKSSLPD